MHTACTATRERGNACDLVVPVHQDVWLEQAASPSFGRIAADGCMATAAHSASSPRFGHIAATEYGVVSQSRHVRFRVLMIRNNAFVHRLL